MNLYGLKQVRSQVLKHGNKQVNVLAENSDYEHPYAIPSQTTRI